MTDESKDQGAEKEPNGDSSGSDRPEPYETEPAQKGLKPEDRPEPYETRKLREGDSED